MATYNQIEFGKNNEKKSGCLSTAIIDFDEQSVATTETVAVFNLAPKAVVTNAYFVVEKGVTGATATGKITVGSTDTIAAVAFAGVAGTIKGGTVTKVLTNTGAEVTVTIGTADATAGRVVVVVEYDEYTLGNGTYTQI